MVPYGGMEFEDIKKVVKVNIKTFDRVKHLVYERPEWGPILKECLELQKQLGTSGFAGTWVFQKSRPKGLKLPSNLRLALRYGILQRIGRSRSGKRAYYLMPDPAGVDRALRELYPPKKNRRPTL